jgi:branched-subunit amino acid aminotransferase/4-amino-4-deoxychorismate lyase
MCNVFAVFDGTIVTPPADGRILDGVTRSRVMQTAAARGVSVVEKYFPIDDLRRADEIFICSTWAEALGVTALDGQDVGKGRTGPLTLKISDWFWQDAVGD